MYFAKLNGPSYSRTYLIPESLYGYRAECVNMVMFFATIHGK